MTNSEITSYILMRNGELSSDEILHIVDTSRNSQINHIVYEDGRWDMWADNGTHFAFTKRFW